MRQARLSGLIAKSVAARRFAFRVVPVADGLVKRRFRPAAAKVLWLADIERHEALFDRAVMKGHRYRFVAAGPVKAGGSLIRGTPRKVDSSPDNDGTGQHRQMAWVRQAR